MSYRVIHGGISIFLSEANEPLANYMIHNNITDDDAYSNARRYNSCDSIDRHVDSLKYQSTITILPFHDIKTGDYLHILSNMDGVFVWTDKALERLDE